MDNDLVEIHVGCDIDRAPTYGWDGRHIYYWSVDDTLHEEPIYMHSPAIVEIVVDSIDLDCYVYGPKPFDHVGVFIHSSYDIINTMSLLLTKYFKEQVTLDMIVQGSDKVPGISNDPKRPITVEHILVPVYVEPWIANALVLRSLK